jgi:hypothetical protein
MSMTMISTDSEIRRGACIFLRAAVAVFAFFGTTAAMTAEPASWRDDVVAIRDVKDTPIAKPYLHLTRQDFEKLEINCSVIKTPMKIGDQSFSHGLGTHSV